MKKLFIMLMAVIAISACGKNKETGTCQCYNSDGMELEQYTGLTESECDDKANPTASEYCILF